MKQTPQTPGYTSITNHCSLKGISKIVLTLFLLIFTLNVSAQTADCSCVNSTSNLLTNGSFENGTTGWSTSGGTLTTGTGYVMCGSQNGFLDWTSGTAKIWQHQTGIAGNVYTLKAYAGTHTPGISCSPKLSLIFLNSAGGVISQFNATITKDVTTTGSFLTQYTITATAPAGTVTVRPEASITCNTLKLDAFCLTSTTPPPTVDCSCVTASNNRLVNPSFENGATGWTVTNGNLSTGTGYVMCGAAGGFLNWDAGIAKMYQDITIVPGTAVTFKGYSGTHTPGISCSPKLTLIYLNSTGSIIIQNDAIVTKDVDVTGPSLTQYTITGTAPAGTVTVRVQASITCNTLKVDAFCLTTVPPPACSGGKVTGLYFNKLDGGTDLAITNGSRFTISQLGSLYNIETSNTGTIGSIVYNISGPTSTSNIENTAPYNSPGTGSGAWTGQVGSYSVNLKSYSGSGGSGTICHDTTITFVLLPLTNPDLNTTFVNVAVPGNVNTNDNVPAGTTYGTTPTLLLSPAGSAATLTMNSNGTYSFTANTPGVYTYDVPVCVPGQVAPCPPTKLVITVLNANSNTNAPVANVDIATTNLNTAVTLRTLANDAAGNANNALVPSSVTVTSAPTRGTAIVNAITGDITYTPNAGFSGRDTLTYQVCDNQSPAKCATAIEIITVNPAGTPNSTAAADDYKITSINTAATGNVKTNDTDAEGNTQTVTAQTTTVAGKGTLVLNADGSYTFTPVTGFTGPVDFPYTTCDNGTPQACASATLHILVQPLVASPDLTPRINLNPNNIIGRSSLEITVQVNELRNVTTNGSLITLFVDKQNQFSSFVFNNTQTLNIAGQPVQNNLFLIDALSNPDFYVITTNAVFANSLRRVTFSVIVNPGQTKGTTPSNVYLLNGSGGETNFTNNLNSTVLTFSF